LRVLENRVLRRIFVPKREDVLGVGEIPYLHALSNFILVIKSKRIRWIG
jgi:hypothetical protein